VKTAQAFRPHILDMFEPQDHPDDVLDEEGPRAPYDSAGWTLAFQMGVTFDRILDGFDGPFNRIDDTAQAPAGVVTRGARATGYLISHHQNDAVMAVNRLLNVGEHVFRVGEEGALYAPATPAARAIVDRAARELGLTFTGVDRPPAGRMVALRPARVGLVDRLGGWSTSGWIRWILERFEFPFEVLHLPAVEAGALARRFDVLILPSEFTIGKTTPALKAFVDEGGTLVAIGGATAVARPLGVPVTRPLAYLSNEAFFVPGSVLRVAVDNATPLGYGFGREVDVFFDRSAVFGLEPGAAERGARAVAWFATETPLRSGWAVGQAHLEGTAAIVDAPLGRGRMVLIGPEVTFRAQSHGTFKFLFNAILRPSGA
jgi:hypothetical protein